jgi:hypothetical protein
LSPDAQSIADKLDEGVSFNDIGWAMEPLNIPWNMSSDEDIAREATTRFSILIIGNILGQRHKRGSQDILAKCRKP